MEYTTSIHWEKNFNMSVVLQAAQQDGEEKAVFLGRLHQRTHPMFISSYIWELRKIFKVPITGFFTKSINSPFFFQSSIAFFFFSMFPNNSNMSQVLGNILCWLKWMKALETFWFKQWNEEGILVGRIFKLMCRIASSLFKRACRTSKLIQTLEMLSSFLKKKNYPKILMNLK